MNYTGNCDKATTYGNICYVCVKLSITLFCVYISISVVVYIFKKIYIYMCSSLRFYLRTYIVHTIKYALTLNTLVNIHSLCSLVDIYCTLTLIY